MFKKLIAVSMLLVLAITMFGCGTKPPTRGSITDGVYTNEFFGLSYTIPSGWQALTDAQYQERFWYSLPTNEELAEFQAEFDDLAVVNTTNASDLIILTYSKLFEKGASDDQIKKRLAMKEQNSDFGLIDYIYVGDVKYAIISTPSADGTYFTYYCWSTVMIGKFRPLIKILLSSSETVDNLLTGFSMA